MCPSVVGNRSWLTGRSLVRGAQEAADPALPLYGKNACYGEEMRQGARRWEAARTWRNLWLEVLVVCVKRIASY
jgi:hypothetical protein